MASAQDTFAWKSLPRADEKQPLGRSVSTLIEPKSSGLFSLASLVGRGQRLPKAPGASKFYCKGEETVKDHSEKVPRGLDTSPKGFVLLMELGPCHHTTQTLAPEVEDSEYRYGIDK